MKKPKIIKKIGYGFYCILMIIISVLVEFENGGKRK